MEEPQGRIGPYKLVSKLGHGTFGVVWLAEKQTALATTRVALKMPRDGEIDLEAFRHEAAIWVQASGHTNVLPLIDADVYDGQVVIVSEYAPDGSLEDWRARHGGRAPSAEAACEMMTGVLSGLSHLHARRIIHRDLKPDNILLQGRTPRLADFGISRVLRSTSHVTKNITGTFVYMAPEAFDGRRDEQTDIWAAGVIFYELLAGRLPYDQQDTASLVGAIVRHDPPPLHEGLAPEAVRRVVTRALERERARRYKSAEEMCDDLREAGHHLWLERHGAAAARPAPPARGRESGTPATRVAGESRQAEPRRTRTAWVVAAGAVACAALAVAVAVGVRWGGADSDAGANSLLTPAASSPAATAAPTVADDGGLTRRLDGAWVFVPDWVDEKNGDAALKIRDGRGTLTWKLPFTVLQDVSAQPYQGGYLFTGSNPRLKGANVSAPGFTPDQIFIREAAEGFDVWTIDYVNNKEWGRVTVKSRTRPGAGSGLAALDGEWRLVFPGKTEFTLQLTNGSGALTTPKTYEVEQQVGVHSGTEGEVVLRASNTVLKADKNVRLTDYAPDEVRFQKRAGGDFEVDCRHQGFGSAWRPLKVKSWIPGN